MSKQGSSTSSTTAYTIGQVSRLTGLSTHNIRKWEERYGAIQPQRTDGGDRRYQSEQVARLTLLKELIDAGESIRHIADKSDFELRDLCSKSLNRDVPTPPAKRRIGVSGDSLPTILEQHGTLMPGLEFVDLTSEQALSDTEVEAVLLEKPTLDENIFEQVAAVRRTFSTDVVVVLYGYAPQSLAVQLSTDVTASLRMPVNYRELQRTVMALLSQHSGAKSMLEAKPVRYSKAVLARVAALSPTIACECPRHVAELIFALSDFETYSANCEDKNPADAAVHNYLRLTASHARVAFEQALSTVAAHEQIPLEDWQAESIAQG